MEGKEAQEALDPKTCPNNQPPHAKPCECRAICAKGYGEHVRRLKRAFLNSSGKKRKEAYEKWLQFIRWGRFI